MKKKEIGIDDNPLWYKDAIFYELHVRAFYDSNADGVGDFRGLAEKLDYLQDLGITTIWLLPFNASPLKDDGYDISDYASVHPSYGTLNDFKAFLRGAHERGIRVVTELVINHTSDQHAWFLRARRAKPGSASRNFYVWSDTADKYKEARVIFKDFESSNWTWDPVAQASYWHRFYSHQPDLNFDNLEVRKAIFQVMDFWLDQGVDGLRLDAVPYLFEREGTTCENLPETHAFLREIRRHVDERHRNRMLLAEANQWPEEASGYFGAGQECHMAFHFPVMPRLFMAIWKEDRFPVMDILEQTPPIPEACQWALFLRNHDELTLEMVTDEDRDYMYRVYAMDPQARINLGIRRRLAPLLGNHRRRIELMNGLLFSLPGSPIIYYGDEIGMGENIYLGDRNGVRTPMQWSADRNAGFSRANPQKLYLPVVIDPEYHYEALNVEAQQNNPHSSLWWMKRLIALRKRFKAFGRGRLEFLHPENRKVLAFLRRYENENILVVANLSRFVQAVELDLSEWRGGIPVEMFSGSDFPPVGEAPYFITLGPHAFYWFSLETRREVAADVRAPVAVSDIPVIGTRDWEEAFQRKTSPPLGNALSSYLRRCRWFAGKARRLRSAEVLEAIPISHTRAAMVLAKVEYAEGDPDVYVLPLAFDETGAAAGGSDCQFLVARVKGRDQEGILYEPTGDAAFCRTLLESIQYRRRFKGSHGELVAWPTRFFLKAQRSHNGALEPSVLKEEQTNTSINYGDRFILKLFRRLGAGTNPELEFGRFLAEKARFTGTSPLAGALEYQTGGQDPLTVGILQGFVSHQADAWDFTLDTLNREFERILTQVVGRNAQDMELPLEPLVDIAARDIPAAVCETIGPYIESADLLGRRTAELHVALASATDNPGFAPEPFTPHYQRSLYQSMRTQAGQAFQLLKKRVKNLPAPIRADAEAVVEQEEEVLRRFGSLLDRKITAVRIRCHGDYHLGQVLYTGKDFVIIDFEGEPARPLSERRIKRCPLRDVAGMVRSFDYAYDAALFGQRARGVVREEDVSALEPWGRYWHFWVSVGFLKAYLRIAGQSTILPPKREDLRILLDVYLLDKAIYELLYELHYRPDWLKIPLRGVRRLLEIPAS